MQKTGPPVSHDRYGAGGLEWQPPRFRSSTSRDARIRALRNQQGFNFICILNINLWMREDFIKRFRNVNRSLFQTFAGMI